MAKYKRRKRKQRVVIRAKRREHRAAKARGMFLKTALTAVAGGAAFLLLTQSDSLFGRFVKEHTPAIEFKAPKMLTNPALPGALPQRPFVLWFPGTGKNVRRELMEKNPGVKGVVLERHFLENRIVVRMTPRIPILQIGEQGMDADGVIFPAPPGTWSALPRATLTNVIPRPVLGRWVAQASKNRTLWDQVVAVSDDPMGDVILDLKTGARVVWGPPEPEQIRQKTDSLIKTLEDAHDHLGGAAVIDLRFFDEGRIIVKPKKG